MKKEVSDELVVPVAADVAYRVWADFERFPRWMDHLLHVEKTGKRTSRWVMRRDDGGTAEWTTEVTVDDPGKELAWSSVEGDLITYGRVRFKELGPKKTRVTVSRFHAAARKGDRHVVARLGDPALKLRADLEGYVRFLRETVAAPRRVPKPGSAVRRVPPMSTAPGAPAVPSAPRTPPARRF